MTEVKHTPTKWSYYKDTCAKCEANGTAEYKLDGPSAGYHGQFANEDEARLAAAAPELYRELRGAGCPRPCNHRPDDFEVGQCVDAGECGCSLGAAIAKAEGRS